MRSVPHPGFTLVVVAALSCCGTPSPKLRAPEATGRIEGTVHLAGGELPSETQVHNTTDPDVCGTEHTLEDLVVSPENRGIRYAIVSVGGLSLEAIPPYQAEPVVLDNVGCRFSPHASVITVGSTVAAVNSDPILHTTHLYGPADVNISLPVKGVRSTRRLEKPGTYVVKCDIHGWMQAFVRVDPHPYHSVTDESGGFRLDGVPVGTYTLEVWHEKLGSRETEVRVEEGTTVSVLVEYTWTEN